MSTDASLLGWGDVSEGRPAGGRWGPGEITHINVLELKAVLLGLQSLCRVTNSHVLVKTDSTTALWYIRQMGGV